MKQPKRYHIVPRLVKAAPDDSESYFADFDDIEALNGDWVKWSDIEAIWRSLPDQSSQGKPADEVKP